MKILHVIPSVSPSQGGTSFALKAMVRSLAAAGLAVDVATTNDDGGAAILDVRLGQETHEDGVRYFYFPRQTQFYKVSLPLSRWLERNVHQYDLVHVHAVFSYASVLGARIAWRHSIPYMMQPHGILNLWGMINRRPLFKQVSFKWIEQPILRRSAAICFTTEQERREVLQSTAGLSEVRSAVVPLGIDTQIFQVPVSPAIFLDRFPVARDRQIVLFLSRLDAKKGLDLLIEAFGTVHQQVPESLLVIAGEGSTEFTTDMQRRIAMLGMEKRVLWTGFLDGELKLSALAAATVFTLPSYSENFGIAVAEALAAGVPCVLSDQVAIAPIAAAAGAATTVPCQVPALAAALTRTLIEPETRDNLSVNARNFANENFSLEATGKSLINLYRTIIK